MPPYHIIQSLDRLSRKQPIYRSHSSLSGCIGTFMFLALCLGFYLPAVVSYFKGNFQQYMFQTNQNFNQQFYSKDDYKLAIVFRHKTNGSLFDHSKILNNLQALVYSFSSYNTYYEPLMLCDQRYFINDINGIILQDCLIIPDSIELNAGYNYESFTYMNFSIKAPPIDNPFTRSTFKITAAQQIYTDILTNYYTEFYFTQKVLTSEGSVKFKLHRAYSTEINVGSDTIGANFNIFAGLRTTLMDSSIMPWKNKQNITTISWAGKYLGYSALTVQQAAINGVQQSFSVINNLQIAVRYYKKLDWLLGIIGGGAFLYYIIFKKVFKFINKWLMKIKLVNQILLIRNSEDSPEHEDHLAAAIIPVNYIFKRILPCFRNETFEKLIKQSQNLNDVTLLIKKQKVALRNLKKNNLFLPFRPKRVIFEQLEQLDYYEASSINQQFNIELPQKPNILSRNQPLNSSNKQEAIQNPLVIPQPRGINNINNQTFPQIEPIIREEYAPQTKNIEFIELEQQPNNGQNYTNNQQQINGRVHQGAFQSIQHMDSFADIPIITPQKNKKQQSDMPIDPQNCKKFDLRIEQLNELKYNKELNKYFENNATFQAICKQKPESYEEVMQLQPYDRWQGHYKTKTKKCFTRFLQFIAKYIKMLDIFSVRITLIDKTNSTLQCGVFLTLAIICLSVLTVGLTFASLSDIQFLISENYTPTNQLQFKQTTNNKFNAVLCINNPSYYLSANKFAVLNLFTYTNGVYKVYTPIQLTSNDPVLDLPNGLHFLTFPVILTNCYKYPDNVTIQINSNSYFGFNLTTYCPGTPSYCANNVKLINQNFMTAINNNYFLYILPGARLDPKTNNLIPDVFTVPTINYNLIKTMNANMSLQETAYGNKVNLYDDTGNHFMRSSPILKDTNINFGENNRRTYVKASVTDQPAYTFKVKLNQASTDFTLTQKKMDWLFGIIGGVFVFWFMVTHVLKSLYMRFNFNAYIAKIIYNENGYDEFVIKKIIAMLRVPRCLIPKCLELRKDIQRMKYTHDKINSNLSHLTILKYTDICFGLSSSFFRQIEGKNFSSLYLREKIYENEQVAFRHREQQQQQQRQQKNQDIILVQENMIQEQNSQECKQMKMDKKQEQQVQNEQNSEVEGQKENIIDPPQSSFTNCLDAFDEPASFSFRGEQTFSTVTGGICSSIFILFVIIVAYYQVGQYLRGAGSTTSYDIIIDDSFGSKGIKLTTGKDFKLGINFMNSTTLTAINVTNYLSTVGISLLLQQYTRQNGIVTPKITAVDLIPCQQGYLQSWVSSNIDITYFNGSKYAYCAPDGIELQIFGLPEELIRKSFKLSVYNRAGNSTGLANLSQLLNTTHIMLYFSSPRQNSLSRIIQYDIQSILLPIFGGIKTPSPYELNVTFSKSNVTYDDSHDWQSNPLNLVSYRFQPYDLEFMNYQYFGMDSNLWFNISFTYQYKVHTYYITATKFNEVFGIIGGIIAFFYYIISCCVTPFNEYKLRYEIGRQIYLFGKKRIVQRNGERRKLKISDQQKKVIQKINQYSELKVLQAYLLRPFAEIVQNYNFNNTLRRVTLIQKRISKDLSITFFYKNLHRARDSIDKQIKREIKTKLKLTDIYLKKITNFTPLQYTITGLNNYAKLHRLSSYEQMIVFKAKTCRLNIQQIFDNRYLQIQFDIMNENAEINLAGLSDTSMRSMNSSSAGSVISVDQSVNEDN